MLSEVDMLSHKCSSFAGYTAPNCCVIFFLSNISTIIPGSKKRIKMYQTVSSLVLWKIPAAGGWLWGREWLMQNVPSPQEIFLPHTHNPTTSYLCNVVISYSTDANDLSSGGSSARSWSKGQRFGGSWLLSLACSGLLAFQFSGFQFCFFFLCKGDPIDFCLAQPMWHEVRVDRNVLRSFDGMC